MASGTPIDRLPERKFARTAEVSPRHTLDDLLHPATAARKRPCAPRAIPRAIELRRPAAANGRHPRSAAARRRRPPGPRCRGAAERPGNGGRHVRDRVGRRVRAAQSRLRRRGIPLLPDGSASRRRCCCRPRSRTRARGRNGARRALPRCAMGERLAGGAHRDRRWRCTGMADDDAPASGRRGAPAAHVGHDLAPQARPAVARAICAARPATSPGRWSSRRAIVAST